MACLLVSILALALLVVPKVASTSPKTAFIKDVCVGKKVSIDYNMCVNVLNAERGVVSAPNLMTVSRAVAEAGRSTSMATVRYLRWLFAQPVFKTKYVYVLQKCEAAYTMYNLDLAAAIEAIDGKEWYKASTYLKKAYTSDISSCQKAQISEKFDNFPISEGNLVMLMLASVAFQLTDTFDHNTVTGH